MKWSSVIRVPLDVDLAPLVQKLRQQGIVHRVTESSGEQVLWVGDEEQIAHVQQLYQAFVEGIWTTEAVDVVIEQQTTPSLVRQSDFVAQLRRSSMTAAILLACLLVAVLTQLGDNITTVSWFTFHDFQIKGDLLYFMTLEHSLAQGQWWRLVSPILLHFGLLHLAMNMMWYWEIGRRIEYQQGKIFLLLLTLMAALVSNVSQVVMSGPTLFGGLSGVLYAVLGHCWIYQRINPQASYALPKGVVAMMLIWLLLCLFGVVTALGFGQIANTAHVSGLLVGCLSGAVFASLARKSVL
ncbi:rhomboid family intramembrane serine protease [Denitrificimonas sp. JX-1]|uniref:Rhomboid family intramembrane serine protease n=1 Tax=Denitrificimonas halotolerans TaxID=3098930 RepID=A0ABU5GPS2_9GAMM|nr:rhomboid family intramembrane serine protease [Denitrificimonas sp. JX-1]MDY7218864.1 rhomboid family intramembrane serine protease [Denitrificimonas sp. JX-1]